MLSMGLGMIDPNNPITELNSKLHQSDIYNSFQTGVSMVSSFTGAASQNMACFIAGTMVLTTAGLVAIEKIKAGDIVISTNPDTFETAEKSVLETYVRQVDKLVHLTINGEEIVTTIDHPFYVQGRGFINAGNLLVGDRLVSVNGEDLSVDDCYIEECDFPTTVYNFQVEDYHTYFVGQSAVWVHNAEYDALRPELPEFDGKTTSGVMLTSDGKQISFSSGNSSNPSYPQYKAQSASHVEGKAAIYMRENGINDATIFHNNPNGTCGFCDRQLSALLPEGSRLTVVPPKNSVANNARAVPVPKTYVGNKTMPTIKF